MPNYVTIFVCKMEWSITQTNALEIRKICLQGFEIFRDLKFRMKISWYFQCLFHLSLAANCDSPLYRYVQGYLHSCMK